MTFRIEDLAVTVLPERYDAAGKEKVPDCTKCTKCTNTGDPTTCNNATGCDGGSCIMGNTDCDSQKKTKSSQDDLAFLNLLLDETLAGSAR